MLVAIALTSIIGTAATMSIHQVITGTALSNNHNTVINQVRNAGYWINRDVQMTQPGTGDTTIICGDNTSTGRYELVQLKQKVWEESGLFYTVEREFTYYFPNSTGTQDLHREDYYTSNPAGKTDSIIAKYIDVATTNCTYNEIQELLTLNITASYHGVTRSRTYEIALRRTI